MERRYELRLEQMLAQAEVSPERMRGLFDRLKAFVEPFARSLDRPEQRCHAAEYMTGLLSKLPRKSGEAIAYLHDHHRQGLQNFVGPVPWDDKPLLATLARQVGEDLGEPDAVIVFDPSAFAKKGTKSVGVARQMVRPTRQGRELPGRRLPGLRLPERTRTGRRTPLSPQGMGEGSSPPQGGGRARGGQVPHPPSARPGDAR